MPSHIFVISPTWPKLTTGYGIALSAMLDLLGSRKISTTAIVFDHEPWEDNYATRFPEVDFRYREIRRPPEAVRFARSLLSLAPAACQSFRPSDHLAAIEAAVGEKLTAQRIGADEITFLFIDIPCCVLMGPLRKCYPDAGFHVHSHNVVADVFLGLRAKASPPAKIAWSYEIARLQRLERHAVTSSDLIWTITDRDRERYRELYGASCDGVIGLYIDNERYRDVPAGNPLGMLHLGSLDLRKGQGMRRFIQDAWPSIRRKHGAATLSLGGLHTKNYDQPEKGIRGLGKVDGELEFLGSGLIFLNPQMSGSGIKIKSLTAMAAGKILISTPVGIEGIDAKPGEHYLLADSPSEFTPLVLDVLENPERYDEMRAAARDLIQSKYSREGFLRQCPASFPTASEAARQSTS